MKKRGAPVQRDGDGARPSGWRKTARFLGATGALEQQFDKFKVGVFSMHFAKEAVNQGGTAGYVSSL